MSDNIQLIKSDLPKLIDEYEWIVEGGGMSGRKEITLSISHHNTITKVMEGTAVDLLFFIYGVRFGISKWPFFEDAFENEIIDIEEIR
jgi:hypothetical protein